MPKYFKHVWYLCIGKNMALHIDITEIDICPPILIYRSVDILPIDIHIDFMFFKFCTKSIFQKNTVNTLWLSRIIIPILNITLTTLNPMVIITRSPHFSNTLGVMPFARRIFAKNTTNPTPNQHFCLHMFNDILLICLSCIDKLSWRYILYQ